MRLQVTALAVVFVTVVLVIAAAIVVVVQYQTLSSALDAALVRRAADLGSAIAAGTTPSLPGEGDEEASQLVTTAGAVLASSRNVAGLGPLAPDPVDDTAMSSGRLDIGSDETFRILSRRVASPDGHLILHVAIATDDIGDSVRVLVISLAVTVPLAIGALAIVVWWMVGRSLAPVEAIRVEVESIGGDELGRRVPVPPVDDEIGRLARTMNDMLARLEDAAVRQRRFAADASHELRSPLTRIRTELEVDLAAPTRSDLEATHRSVLDEVTVLERLVGDLLTLARSDAGTAASRIELVDLDDIVGEEVRSARAVTAMLVDSSQVSGAQVNGDRVLLARAVRNLIENAVHHAASRIDVGLEERDGFAVLTVSDDGPGVPPDERERIFERFARVDEGRTPNEGGTGLGLSIVRAVALRHGGDVSVDTTAAGGARFVMSVPSGS